MTRGLTGNELYTYVYNHFFGVLCKMSVLVAARCIANAVAQICKMLSHPSKCVLIFRRKYIGKGHHVISRVWICSDLCQVR